MLPEHMPYYRGPRIHRDTNTAESRDIDITNSDDTNQMDTNANTLLATILPSINSGPASFFIRPVAFGNFGPSSPTTGSQDRHLYNADLPVYAHSIAKF